MTFAFRVLKLYKSCRKKLGDNNGTRGFHFSLLFHSLGSTGRSAIVRAFASIEIIARWVRHVCALSFKIYDKLRDDPSARLVLIARLSVAWKIAQNETGNDGSLFCERVSRSPSNRPRDAAAANRRFCLVSLRREVAAAVNLVFTLP